MGARLTEPATEGWDRSSLAFIAASFASLSGIFCLTTAVGKQVYDLSHRELDLGIVGLVEFAPALLLILFTGTIADRHRRKNVAAIAALGTATACALMGVYVSTDPTAVGPIFAIALLFGVARAFYNPASRALISDVVPPERLPWLVPRRSSVVQASFIVGPVLGGTLYAVAPVVPYIAATGLVLTASVLLASMDVQNRRGVEETSPSSRLHDTLEGFRFVRRHRVLLATIGLDLFAVLFGGAAALLPAIAEERLGVGAVGFGWLRASIGIGGGAMSLWLARRPVTRHVGRTMLITTGMFGACTIVLGATTVYAVAFGALVVLSAADAISVYIRSTVAPLVTPPHMRGRVSAVEMVFIGATNELGSFESGVTGQWFGAGPAVVVGGVATIGIVGLWAIRFPELRALDRFPGTDSADD